MGRHRRPYNPVRTRGAIIGHNVRYVLAFRPAGVIIAFVLIGLYFLVFSPLVGQTTAARQERPCANSERIMSAYEKDVIKLLAEIANDLRWLKRRAEEHDRIKKQEQNDLFRRIEETHRGPTKTRETDL